MRLVFGLLLGFTLLVGFQNCSGPFDFSALEQKSEANGNGTGYDGKATYVNFGHCGDPLKLEHKATIEVATDGSAQVTRENCANLSAPYAADPSAIRHSIRDPSVFVYNRDIFDFADSGNKRVTRLLCWNNVGGGTQELMLWYYGDALLSNTSPVLSAQLTTTSGEQTDVFSPLTETYSSTIRKVTYSMTNVAGDSMSMSVYSSGGTTVSTSYSFSSSAYTCPMTATTDCYTQAIPFKVY